MSGPRRDLALSSGAYVLHGLDPEERAWFEAALVGSAELRSEVTELADTAVELGLALAPVAPGELLRARVLAQIGAMDAVPSRRRLRRVESGRRMIAHPGVIAAAAAVAVVVALGAVQVQTAAQRADASARIAAAADARSSQVTSSDGGAVQVRWSHEVGAATATGRQLPALSGGRVYELWYLDGAVARPAGVFDGQGTIDLSGRLHAGDTIAMTIERAGGSESPSGVPIAAVAT